jgi:hypothetical protein
MCKEQRGAELTHGVLQQQATARGGAAQVVSRQQAGNLSLPTYVATYVGERVASRPLAYEFAYGMYVASTLLI